MRYISSWSIVLLGFFFTFAALAAGALPEAPDTWTAITGAISAVKVGAIAPIVVAIVQVLRSNTVAGLLAGVSAWWMRTIVTTFTVAGNIAYEVASGGKTWWLAAIEGLVIGGGAMAIYDTVKSIKK